MSSEPPRLVRAPPRRTRQDDQPGRHDEAGEREQGEHDAQRDAGGAAARLMTVPGLADLLSGGWSIYWNDLLAGAHPSADRVVARGLDTIVRRAFAAVPGTT